MAWNRYGRLHNKKNSVSISLLLLLLLFLSVGYAYVSTSLSLTGNTEIASNTWDIHFENLEVSNDSSVVDGEIAIDPLDSTKINFDISLGNISDRYIFTFDIANSGTLPGMISSSYLTGITGEDTELIDYTISYLDGFAVSDGDIINAGENKTIKIEIKFKDGLTIDDLPEEEIIYNVTYDLNFVQSENDAP